jgi:hypothetical protein
VKKKLLPLFLCSFFLKATILKVEDQEWAWTYRQCFTSHEMRKNSHKQEVLFTQISIAPFTQLIFAWNAQRPQKGYFTFYAQVRDAKTKRWYSYHKMIDWGQSVQRSHFNRSEGSAFHYARLELENWRKADGFRVKAVAHHHQDLGLLKGLIAATSDHTKFKPEPWSEHAKGLKSIMLKGVPKTSQILVDHPKADVLCSPTSMSMVIGSLKRKKVDALSFADHVYDQGLNAFGNWSFNTAHAYEFCDHKVLFYPTRLSSFTSLYNILKNKIPAVVSVRGPLKDAPKPFEKGHLLVVIGWDAQKKQVICHDPAFDSDQAVLARYDVHEFIRAWERSRRMTYKPHLII